MKQFPSTLVLLGSLVFSGCHGPAPEKGPAQVSTLPADSARLPAPSQAYPLTLGFRPQDAHPATVNPPRFSWSYDPEIRVPESEQARDPLRRFRFQISSDPDFSEQVVDVETEINFYNALAPLPPGNWYWRVGYSAAEAASAWSWSEARSFSVQEETPRWDRSMIPDLPKRIAAIPHPRLGPQDGDWSALLALAESDPLYRKLAFLSVQEARKAMESTWWKEGLPETDQLGNPWKLTRKQRLQFNDMAKGIANAAFCWKLTGDEQFARAKDLLIEFARYEPGGLSSPEWHGNPHKFGTETIKFLALSYDWLYHDLSETQRQQLREAIAWRLEKVFYGGKSWAAEGKVDPLGMAMKMGSHPYQNAMWSMPALLVLAGEAKISDRALPLLVNYTLGVGASQGPEQAYNEGHGYANEKGGVLLDAMLALDMLVPELKQEQNPQLRGLGDWYLQIFPIGIERLSWGDQWPSIIGMQVQQVYNQYKLAWLSGEGRYRHRAEALQEWRFHGSRIPVIHDPWFMLLAFQRLQLPERDPEAEPRSQLFAEAGWMFAGSHRPSDWKNWKNAVQLQMQARPMGKSSHSYHADGAFLWNAYGKSLSAGGDKLKFMNPYNKEAEAHSSLLVNGQGIRYSYNQSYVEEGQPPWTARPLAWEEGEDYVYWAVDLTPGFFKQPGVTQVIRHVVMLKQSLFVIYDDVRSRPGDQVSWLMKLHHPVPVEVSEQDFRFQVEEVQAQVYHAGASGATLQNLSGREGYVNPVSGKDWGPEVNQGMQRMAKSTLKGQADPDADYLQDIPVWNNFWVTRKADESGHATFLSTLMAWKGSDAPTLTEISSAAFQFRWPDGSEISISFDPEQEATLRFDPAKISAWREETP